MAAKAAPSALVVATRAADGGCGAGYSDPPFALQGGHCVRRPKGRDESHQHQGGTCRASRTLLGRWQAHRGERPAALSEPWPQGMLLRHDGVGYEIVLSLDVPVPQLGEQLPNIVQFFAVQLPVVAEPVIEVPKILLERTPQRLGDRLRQPQMVEQLVDVPTVVSFSSLQQLTAEQTVDIPLPHSGGLQGSRPGQGSTASSSHVGAADGAGQGVFFRTFPRGEKSAGQGAHSGSELSADFNPSTLSAHQMPLEQLVDVPVPQVHERSSRSLLYERGNSLLEGLHRRQEAEEAARWREQIALLEEEQMDEEEEEEEVEVSRFLPHFRPRRWCRYVLACSICPHGWQCTFAHHESELHPDSW